MGGRINGIETVSQLCLKIQRFEICPLVYFRGPKVSHFERSPEFCHPGNAYLAAASYDASMESKPGPNFSVNSRALA